MSSAQQLAAVLEAGGPELSRALHRTETRLAEVAEGHGAELASHAAGTLTAGGKRLRPVLVYLCGGEGEGLLEAATAVELLHMATLVHDDVLDAAALRRGRPTVFAAAGRLQATATGAHDLGDRSGDGHQRFFPTCRAMMPPAVRTHRMSPRPARSMAAARPSGPGKRFTELGR